MKREYWIVGDEGIRPNGKPDRCFYCGQLKGQEHKLDCVIRSRTVVVRLSIEYVIDVPEFWTEDNIEFHRNESSWCTDNALEELRAILENTGGCLCEQSETDFVREATAEDEQRDGIFVDKLPS